ncbi:MAG: class II glutamine amidotransferase [Polyangiaceae bacterium]
MCRFAVYLGPPIAVDTLTTKPAHSVIKQSYQAAERVEPLNGDGFGVAWYSPALSDQPAAYRAVTPAWSDENLLHIARVTESGCILAHVRAATPGLGVSPFNCHPFLAGRLAFMHNGHVSQFGELKRSLMAELPDPLWQAVRGTTDSEVLFALTQHHLASRAEGPPELRFRGALEDTLATLERVSAARGIGEPHQLNLCLTDGEALVVTRHATGDEAPNSLYLHRSKRYVCVDDLSEMIAPDERGPAVLVASERLTSDPGWERIAPNHAVIVSEARAVEVVPFPRG